MGINCMGCCVLCSASRVERSVANSPEICNPTSERRERERGGWVQALKSNSQQTSKGTNKKNKERTKDDKGPLRRCCFSLE